MPWLRKYFFTFFSCPLSTRIVWIESCNLRTSSSLHKGSPCKQREMWMSFPSRFFYCTFFSCLLSTRIVWMGSCGPRTKSTVLEGSKCKQRKMWMLFSFHFSFFLLFYSSSFLQKRFIETPVIKYVNEIRVCSLFTARG